MAREKMDPKGGQFKEQRKCLCPKPKVEKESLGTQSKGGGFWKHIELDLIGQDIAPKCVDGLGLERGTGEKENGIDTCSIMQE